MLTPSECHPLFFIRTTENTAPICRLILPCAPNPASVMRLIPYGLTSLLTVVVLAAAILYSVNLGSHKNSYECLDPMMTFVLFCPSLSYHSAFAFWISVNYPVNCLPTPWPIFFVLS
ncbi:hypothetical protein CRM22_002343 [Opisthorchis felineus]|uniref:Uncharacterized protein n=1 Tax=Opisthorchis felineus TaxID=147828 RepID=A0A4S2M6F0_OPIFE|nr:hypothetical protein CRM22_002343 [Opisthorchis felineus]